RARERDRGDRHLAARSRSPAQRPEARSAVVRALQLAAAGDHHRLRVDLLDVGEVLSDCRSEPAPGGAIVVASQESPEVTCRVAARAGEVERNERVPLWKW